MKRARLRTMPQPPAPLEAKRVGQPPASIRERARPDHVVPSEYADLFDFAPMTCVVIDDVGLIVRISVAAARLLNVERDHLIGVSLSSFVVPEDRHEWLDHLRRCRDQGTVVESEIRFVSRFAARLTCRVHTRRSWYDGRELYPTLIADQSELRALDEARLAAERRRERAERETAVAIAASEGKDTLIAAVSHELRTPLAPALIAAAQLAASAELPEVARRMAATIKRNIEVQARLIDDLLDVARLRSNRLELCSEPVDIHQILLEAIAICGAAADAKSLTIARHFSAESRVVMGDPSRLRQVFWNLINNAIKFSADHANVTVSTANLADTTITVEVRDYGMGMSPSAVALLFTPFHQTARKESRTGLGLGLTICKGVVDAHAGRIWGASDGPSRGSTFAVELTTTPNDRAEIAPKQESADTVDLLDIDAFDEKRVLLIEDDADSSEMMALSLSHHGYVVEVASCLAEGLARLDEEWDIVMSDIRLPDGSGLDVARRALALSRPPGKLIALSGFGSDDDILASRQAGFDLHLVKPVDFDRLLSLMGAEQATRER